MILISHRGNTHGIVDDRENSPDYIEEAIKLGFNVEIDVWVISDEIFLGHDYPTYKIKHDWLLSLIDKLWIHCKNIGAIEYFNSHNYFNYFWHENDTLTLTSGGFIWAYPGKQPIRNSIAVLPELNKDDISYCLGICSDFIYQYKEMISENNL